MDPIRSEIEALADGDVLKRLAALEQRVKDLEPKDTKSTKKG